MQQNHVALYAEFLSQFRSATGPIDILRLENDPQYKHDLIEKMMANLDDDMLEMANTINQDFSNN